MGPAWTALDNKAEKAPQEVLHRKRGPSGHVRPPRKSLENKGCSPQALEAQQCKIETGFSDGQVRSTDEAQEVRRATDRRCSHR
jgi:hypothetical protein